VSHNYLRNFRYNMWFTLALPEKKEFSEVIEDLMRSGPAEQIPYIILPSLATFKIRVQFDLSESTAERSSKPSSVPAKNAVTGGIGRTAENGRLEITEKEKNVIRAVQVAVPPSPRPWKEIGDNLNIEENEVLDIVKRLKQEGIIRRISGILRHRKVGYTANAMTCFDVPEEKMEKAGQAAAAFPQVSHCYRRPRLPEWQYPLFAMVHAKNEAECWKTAVNIAEAIACKDYIMLFSTKELKKERVHYLTEEL
jgi:siroheme decarboxylase